MAKYVMALDAGTTSSRCILFDQQGHICSMAQKEFTQYFPHPGWVEHDANEIWQTQLNVARQAMTNIEAKYEDIAAIGISARRRFSGTGRPGSRLVTPSCGSAAGRLISRRT